MHRTINRRLVRFAGYVFLSVFIVFAGYTAVYAGKSIESKAVFYVRWYDVGRSVLEGLEGIKRVESGFLNHKEINRVYYDPGIISIEEMKTALKKAGTYIGMEK